MPDQVQLRGGTDNENDSFTGAQREVTVDTTNKTLRVHDGTTAGGSRLAAYDEWGRLQVEDPENDTDVANKGYVDGQISGSVGFVPVGTLSFSDVAITSLNDVFTDVYDEYTVRVRATLSAVAVLRMRLRASGTDDDGSNYDRRWMSGAGTTASVGGNTANDHSVTVTSGDGLLVAEIMVSGPALAANTQIVSQAGNKDTSVNVISTRHTTTAVFDGLSLFPASGTITGVMDVYGFKRAV